MANSERQWIGIADLMSVLMIVFLFIAIVFMLKVQEEHAEINAKNQAVQAIVMEYQNTQENIRAQLEDNFRHHLHSWNASILSDGAIRFSRPQSLFTVGSSELTPQFKQDLAHFFPSYIALLANSEWRDDIDEIRIEGHTSSDWQGGSNNPNQQYIFNARLSQERAFAVLEFVYNLPAVQPHQAWLKKVLRATGASHSKPALINGVEDKTRSRRVEFSTRIKSEDKLNDIIENLEQGLTAPQ